MSKFLPCPFCGSTRIGCHHGRSGRKSGYQCMCLDCKVKQSGSYHDSPETAAAVWNTRKPLAGSEKRWPPVAYGAHRYGRWGYIWHTEEDVAAWIEASNRQIIDPNAHWHGPVALYDDIEALAEELELKRACIAGMSEQMDELASSLEHCRQWYAVRLERLRDLVKPLPEETRLAFYAIVANSTAGPHEEPSYSRQMNLLRHERDDWERRADNLGAMLGRMTYATRNAEDATIVEVRKVAIELIRKLGASSPLRSNQA